MSRTSRTVLLVGSTGSIGREVLDALLAMPGDRPTIRVLVRNAATVSHAEAVEVVVGDLRDSAAVTTALRGVDAALYISPHEKDEVALAERFIQACEREGARLVFVGVHVAARTRFAAGIQRRLFGMLVPAYKGKFAIGRAAERSSAHPVVIAPTNFMQNDDIFARELAEGVFVQPLSRKGINRVDLRDVGELAARALTEADFPAGVHSVVGPESLSGAECARVWSEALGRPIRYAGEEDGVWAAALERNLSGHKRADWTASFGFLSKFGVKTNRRDLAATTRLLGRPPRSYAQFVRDRVAASKEPVRR